MFKNVVKEQLKVPAHIDHLADLRDFVTRIGRKYGFSDRVINAFKLAIDEAATNIMRHAYRDYEGQGFITIRAVVKQNSLTICLIDQGKYFDPKHVKDPDLQRYVNIGKKGGLGIFIIRRLMDEMDYRKTEEGNELRLTKNRDTAPTTSPSTKSGAIPTAIKAVKSIPLTLKAKYWVRTSLILTVLIGLGYLYYFFEAKRKETTRFFTEFINISNVASNTLQDPQILDDASGLQASEAIAKIYANEEVRKIIHEIVIVDSTGSIIGHVDQQRMYEKLKLPTTKAEVRPGVFFYSMPVYDREDRLIDKEVYDRITSVGSGELHIRTVKTLLDSRIVAQRWFYVRMAGIILLVSCAGSFLLIYILMNPFRKLADWVRSAGHGEIEDEMDIDASTEIGEIAQAFSEITNKFRESQKNLAEQERLQKEMQVAQEIQQTLLPSEFPEVEGYELASYYEAAREVGGDYYDFVEVDKDTLGIAVADVSGKGVPGSLVMTMIRTALRTEARGVKDAAEVLSRVNDFVMGDMKKGMFVTVFYVIVDSKRRRVNYASAGHNPMILYRPSTQKTYYLNPRGFPIGIQLHEKDLFKKSIESDTIQLMEDDILLIYTDGITEAMNAQRQLFGEERLLKIFREHGQLRVNPFVDKIKEEILSFTEGNPQSDDITLVAIREKTSPEKEELRRAKEAHRLITQGASIREACESVGITTYAYYNKYKKEFEEKGIENFEIDADISVEAKHIALEDKVKIYDIIKNHPEFGAKRISEELNTEKYGFTAISESKIYDELVRSRLNTRQLREAFVARGGRTRRPMKQPGTPMITLDGKIILDRSRVIEPAPEESTPTRRVLTSEKHSILPKPATEEPPIEITPRRPSLPAMGEPAPAFASSDVDSVPPQQSDMDADLDSGAFYAPLEELLDKTREHETSSDYWETTDQFGQTEPSAAAQGDAEVSSDAPDFAERSSDQTAPSVPPLNLFEEGGIPARDVKSEPSPGAIDISFEDLFAGGSILEDYQPAFVVTPPASDRATPRPKPVSATPEEERADDEAQIFALDELLQQQDDGDLSSATMAVVMDEEDSVTSDAGIPSQAQSKEGDEVEEQKPSEELPFVEVGEILAQSTSEAVTSVIIEPAAVEEVRMSQPNRAPQSSTIYLGSDLLNPRTDEVTENGRHLQTATARPGASGQRGDGRNGMASASPGEDERERLLIAGLRHYKNQRFNEAIAEFEKAIHLYPNFKEAYSILGNAYFRNRMFDEAAAAYHRVKEIDPFDTTAYENMGVIHANRSEYAEAMKEWQRVLEIDPSRDDIRKKIERANRMLRKAAV